jgi:hypothetical protein
LALIFKLLLALLILILLGCASVPNGYNQTVIVIRGAYTNEIGTLEGDCSGFEKYKVRLHFSDKRICVRIWNIRRIE